MEKNLSHFIYVFTILRYMFQTYLGSSPTESEMITNKNIKRINKPYNNKWKRSRNEINQSHWYCWETVVKIKTSKNLQCNVAIGFSFNLFNIWLKMYLQLLIVNKYMNCDLYFCHLFVEKLIFFKMLYASLHLHFKFQKCLFLFKNVSLVPHFFWLINIQYFVILKCKNTKKKPKFCQLVLLSWNYLFRSFKVHTS